MFDFDDDQENIRAGLRVLTRLLFACLFIIVLQTGLVFYALQTIEVSLPPDLGQGAVLKRDRKDPAEVYLFALNLFQQLQRWRRDGAEDYPENIRLYGNYITPQYRQWLEQDLARRLESGELTGRRRHVEPADGFAYSEATVQQIAADAWIVNLGMNLVETLNNRPIKDLSFVYPLRVVRIDRDRQENSWRLALDGYHDTPGEISRTEP